MRELFTELMRLIETRYQGVYVSVNICDLCIDEVKQAAAESQRELYEPNKNREWYSVSLQTKNGSLHLHSKSVPYTLRFSEPANDNFQTDKTKGAD